MDLSAAREFLLWCTVINYGILLLWFLFFTLAHDWMYRFHGIWFGFTLERFDGIHYLALALYKIGILLFNLVPLLVLCLIM